MSARAKAAGAAAPAEAGTAPGPKAPDVAPAPTLDSLGTRTTSIARSIAVSTWFRRLGGFLALDAAIVAAFVLAFFSASVGDVSDAWGLSGWPAAGVELRVEWGSGGASRRSGRGEPFDLETSRLVFNRDGETRTYATAPVLPYFYAVGVVVLVGEGIALESGFHEARRIRRRLKPLNDLALTADSIANAPDAAVDLRMEHLEQAIACTAPDAESITTGDEDLRSIEVALNALLRRMRAAQEQQMRFVSDASHELRTPIAVIDGYVSMLDRWGKSDPQVLEESIAALKAESAQMRELVEQLLFLARGDSGRQTIEPTEFDLAVLAEELAEEARLIDADHEYAAAATAPVPVTADRGLVKQCGRIIVQNAAHYSAAGTKIEVGGRPGPGCAQLWVEDRGIGMSAEDAAHVFDRFYRADGARDRSAAGSGLGLAIAKWIAEAHGGSIEVLSREGIGSRFTVSLPTRSKTAPNE